jgi:hypothetical protein
LDVSLARGWEDPSSQSDGGLGSVIPRTGVVGVRGVGGHAVTDEAAEPGDRKFCRRPGVERVEPGLNHTEVQESAEPEFGIDVSLEVSVQRVPIG